MALTLRSRQIMKKLKVVAKKYKFPKLKDSNLTRKTDLVINTRNCRLD